MNSNWFKFAPWLPAIVAVMALAALSLWWTGGVDRGVVKRVPGTDAPPGVDATALANPAQTGKVTSGPGQPANLPGAWPQFRGPARDGMSASPPPLARSWPTDGPPKLWTVPVGEGYAGPAVEAGRVFLMDYDREAKQSVLRCLSLADGAEIWRYAYPLTIKRNHGMTRTAPTLAGGRVVAIDSKCNVLCCDAVTGKLYWAINLVREFGTKIPEWYAGQCPLIVSNTVILAPSGPDALLLAVDLETGRPLWQTPNARDWKMTHSSVMPMTLGGQGMYLYCGSAGVAGVNSTNGALLWDSTDWKISIACVPSPVPLPGRHLAAMRRMPMRPVSSCAPANSPPRVLPSRPSRPGGASPSRWPGWPKSPCARTCPTTTGHSPQNWPGSHRPCSRRCLRRRHRPVFCASTANFAPRPRARTMREIPVAGSPPGCWSSIPICCRFCVRPTRTTRARRAAQLY